MQICCQCQEAQQGMESAAHLQAVSATWSESDLSVQMGRVLNGKANPELLDT